MMVPILTVSQIIGVAFEKAGFVATPQLTKKYEQNQRQLLRASQQPRDRKYQHIGDCYLGAIDHT